MKRKKTTGLIFIFIGLALIIAGAIVWESTPRLTSALLISGGILSTIGGLIYGRVRNR